MTRIELAANRILELIVWRRKRIIERRRTAGRVVALVVMLVYKFDSKRSKFAATTNKYAICVIVVEILERVNKRRTFDERRIVGDESLEDERQRVLRSQRRSAPRILKKSARNCFDVCKNSISKPPTFANITSNAAIRRSRRPLSTIAAIAAAPNASRKSNDASSCCMRSFCHRSTCFLEFALDVASASLLSRSKTWRNFSAH